MHSMNSIRFERLELNCFWVISVCLFLIALVRSCLFGCFHKQYMNVREIFINVFSCGVVTAISVHSLLLRMYARFCMHSYGVSLSSPLLWQSWKQYHDKVI